MPRRARARTTGQVDRLSLLMRDQDGIVSRPQLVRCGIPRWRLRSNVDAGRWEIVGRQAVRCSPGDPLRQKWWAAVMNTGPHAVLAGPSALEAAGLVGYAVPEVHVAVPKGSRPRRTKGVVVHELRRLRPDSAMPGRRPPKQRPAVAAIDAALWSSAPARAAGLVAASVQQGLVRAEDLRRALVPIRRHRHRRLLMLVVGDVEGGAQSFAELDFARLSRRAGLPPPDRQAVRLDLDRRRRYLDVEWKAYGLVVEVDGMFHMQVASWVADALRANEVVLGQSRVLRVPALTLRLDPDTVLDQVRRGLVLGGWRPRAAVRAA